MAASQQWRHAGLMVAVIMVVLFIGSADAWGCPAGFKDCDSSKPGCETCISNDVNNCGDCGKKCKALPYTSVKCSDGKCVYTCSSGWGDCDGNLWSNGCETDTGNDANNCGWCGNKCKQVPYATTKCSGGKCQEPVCNPGWANCDGNMWSNGCETDTGNDANNCGWCGNKCKQVPYATTKCSGVKCQEPVCNPGWANCDGNMWSNGCETDTGNDANNCGWCGNKCKQVPYATTKCSGGKCQEPVCNPGWANCDGNMWSNGCETDTGKDVNNCGGCGNKCQVTMKGAYATCSNGKCGQQCNQGWNWDKTKNCCVPGY